MRVTGLSKNLEQSWVWDKEEPWEDKSLLLQVPLKKIIIAAFRMCTFPSSRCSRPHLQCTISTPQDALILATANTVIRRRGPEMPTFKNQKQYSEREKTVFWPPKKYFVKNNEGEGANCIAANLSFKKKVLLSLKNHIWGEKKYFFARSAHHEREARSPFGQGLRALETHGF